MKRYLFIDGQINGGGAERVLIDILRNFDYDHYMVTLLQVNAGGTLIDEVPSQVHLVAAWPGYTRSFSLAYRCSQWYAWDFPVRHYLMQALKGEHFDVAISFLEGMPLKMHAMITDVADRNYSWVHCDLDKDRYEVNQFRRGEEIAAYNKMDAVVCVATDTAKAFQRRFPDCISPVKVIYNPIDIQKIYRLSAENIEATRFDNRFKVVVCGRLTAPKKLDRVLRLARRIKDEGLRIHIQLIGDGCLRTVLEAKAKELGILDIVEFKGFVRNPFPYIKSADMLLSTSGYEGFSLVVCEAMALGIPVVATKTAGPSEILAGNTYGLLCDHDDESIFQAVKRMCLDAKLRFHYTAKGKIRVADFAVVKTMEDIYNL